MAEIDETEVSMSESVDRKADAGANGVELVGSDIASYPPTDETTEREVDVISKELEETDGMLTLTKYENHISVSSGGVKIINNVRRLVIWFEQNNYPTKYRIQIVDQLRELSSQLATQLGIRFSPNVDFNGQNICSVEPTNKEPNKSPNTVFTVTLKQLTECHGNGLKVQFKPGILSTGTEPHLVGTPSLIPSPKPK